jgi:archaellum component FlaF (FlaF/FlaG flagellin family)
MYTVKYWSSDGENILKSKTLNASECPVIFDGTFMLEIINHHTKSLVGLDSISQTFKIHLPQIPTAYNTTGTIKVP